MMGRSFLGGGWNVRKEKKVEGKEPEMVLQHAQAKKKKIKGVAERKMYRFSS